jgi:hypothetical protein
VTNPAQLASKETIPLERIVTAPLFGSLQTNPNKLLQREKKGKVVSLPVDIRPEPSFATYVGLDIALISSTHPTIYFSWLHQYLQYEHFLKLKDVSQYRCFASLSKVLECSGNPATATSLTAFPAMAGNFHEPENLWHQSSSTSLPPAY